MTQPVIISLVASLDAVDSMDAAVIQSGNNIRFEPEIYPDEALRLLTLGLGILRAAALLFIVIFGGRYAMSVMKTTTIAPVLLFVCSAEPSVSRTYSTTAAPACFHAMTTFHRN